MDLSQLTLAEVEALAVRLESAARTIRDAQSLLSGGPPAPIPTRSGVAAMMAIQNGANTPPRGADNPLLTAAENAERRRLIKLNTEPINPDDIEAMERA